MRYVRSTVLVLVVVLAALVTAAFAFRGDASSARSETTAARRRVADTIRPRLHERWRVPIAADVVGLPATDQAGVVVTAGNAQVVAVSRVGKLDWTTRLDGVVANAPRIDHDRVFVAADRVVAALDRGSGRVLWSTPTTTTDDDNRANRPVVADDIVVVTTAKGLVLGLDATTGAERWRKVLPTELSSEPALGRLAGESPVVAVVGLAEWWGLDPHSGATLWSGDLGIFGTSSPVVYADGDTLVAVVASDEHLFAVDARTGAQRWSTRAEQSELFQVPVIAANGNELLVPDHWGRLTAYRPSDGKRMWSAQGDATAAEFGEPVWLGERFVALPLDAHGPRLASPRGAFRLRPPSDGFGIADLPLGGLVVTTASENRRNYVLLYDVSYD